jgi:hypothetical protein
LANCRHLRRVGSRNRSRHYSRRSPDQVSSKAARHSATLGRTQAREAVDRDAADGESVFQLRIGGIGLLVDGKVLQRTERDRSGRFLEEGAQCNQIVTDAVAGKRGISDIGLSVIIGEAGQAGGDDGAGQ